MKWRVFTVLFFMLALSAATGWSGPKPAGDTLGREEATSLLAPVFKNRGFTVKGVRKSPVAGFWEILVETDAGKTVLYVDQSRTYFLGGPIMALQGMKNMTEESLLSWGMPRVDPSQVPLDDALIVGKGQGGKRVVVFLSPTCKPCKDMLRTIKDVSKEREDISFYLKMKPEEPVGESFWRSETIVLTRSMALLEESLEGLKIPRPGRPVPQVAQTLHVAEKLGIHATPTVMLADGTLVEGVLSHKALLGWIERHSPEGVSGKAEGGKRKE